MPGSVTQGAVLLSSLSTHRRLPALSAPELAMLMRFAVLRQLQGEAAAPAAAHQLTSLAAVTYCASRRIEGLDQLWPFLEALAADWIQLRRLS